MGKKLIIKGADFSENAIGEVNVLNITNLLSFTDGVNGIAGNDSNQRCGLLPRFDLSSYISSGYSKIKVVTKYDGQIVFMTSVGGSNDASGDSSRIYRYVLKILFFSSLPISLISFRLLFV